MAGTLYLTDVLGSHLKLLSRYGLEEQVGIWIRGSQTDE